MIAKLTLNSETLFLGLSCCGLCQNRGAFLGSQSQLLILGSFDLKRGRPDDQFKSHCLNVHAKIFCNIHYTFVSAYGAYGAQSKSHMRFKILR